MRKFLTICLICLTPLYANASVDDKSTDVADSAVQQEIAPKWQPYIGANFGINASDVSVHGEDFFDFGGRLISRQVRVITNGIVWH